LGGGASRRLKEARASFLKKRSKKLSFTVGFGNTIASARNEQKFYGSFFQKRTAFCYDVFDS
jgi:hypothetical protein